MVHASGKVLLPIFLVVFACTLLGLIAADTSKTPAIRTPLQAGPVSLPWEPLQEPDAELRAVAMLLESTPAREKVSALVRLAEDPDASDRVRGLAAFAAGVEGVSARANAPELSMFEAPSIAATELSGYALYYLARGWESDEPERAQRASRELLDRYPDLAWIDEARLRYARLLVEAGDLDGAVTVLEPVTTSADASTRGNGLEQMAKILIELERYQEAVDALETLYYRLPRHKRANDAGRRLTQIRSKLPEVPPARLYQLAFDRAKLFYDQRRFRDAHGSFTSLLERFPKVADVELVRLWMAKSQYNRRQITASLANFKRVQRDDLLPEALFYQAEVARRKKRDAEFRLEVAALEARFPKSPFTAQALASLGRFLEDEEAHEEAKVVHERLVRDFPQGEQQLETKWRLFWNAYRGGRFEEAAIDLEEAARETPGADGLGRYLYWAGRAYQESGRLDRADVLFRQVLLGYQNTYYGRRALEHLQQMQSPTKWMEALETARKGIDLSDAFRVDRARKQQRVAELFALDQRETALAEAESAVDGSRDAPAFRSIAAWIHSSEGRTLNAIITIRDAFPFHVSATGDLLPRPIWELFYPLRFREHVDEYAKARGLDPFLVAALIRQESTFNPNVRSPANARGLMQIIPATGKQLARQERRRYQLRDLYNPEINIRYGTRYLKDVLTTFDGRVDYALAGYNAGPHRVKRWTGMDMTIDPEVFIEEIPFAETRNYVKLVLRNEMLYRRLYGDAGLADSAAP